MLAKEPCTGDIIVDLNRVVNVLDKTLVGTLGTFSVAFLKSMQTSLRNSSTAGVQELTPSTWTTALRYALQTLSAYTPAQPGDRSVLDALYPFIEVLGSTGDVGKAAAAARLAAERTKGMIAQIGRTVMVRGKGYEEVPDPGAYAFSEFVSGLADGSSVEAEEEADYEMISQSS